MLHRAHESGIQSQEHERQAALQAFEQEQARQQHILQAEHQAALQVMQTERYIERCNQPWHVESSCLDACRLCLSLHMLAYYEHDMCNHVVAASMWIMATSRFNTWPSF